MAQYLDTTKAELIADLERRVAQKSLEITTAKLLEKLINNAESVAEAISIAQLGTVYKRTGLHYDIRLEKSGNDIRYFKKNEKLSFVTEPSKPVNKLIIGDNYQALQNLLIEFSGAIDVIYLDPPYGKDNMGDFAKTNYDNALTRDNLLSMLYPRLKLAKQLLSPDGVIFCSIDDKNQAYVKCLFDEVFEEQNFVCNFMWKKTDTPPSLSNKVRRKLEYVLCYTKKHISERIFAQGYIDGGDAPFLNAGNPLGRLTFPKGSVRFNLPDGDYRDEEGRSIKLISGVTVKNGVNANDFVAEGHFKWGQSNLNQEINNGTYFLIKSTQFSIRYQKEGNSTKKPSNLIDGEVGVGTNETANSELKKLGFAGQFDYAKPVSLISYLLKMGFWEQDNITVLDFFAGSGTTGHSVLDLNADGGNRRFILCQLNEITETTPNGIAYDVTAPRLKKIMTGEDYSGDKNFKWLQENKPYGGNLDVYELATVADFEAVEGKSPFDVIDETLYGKEKFRTLKEKVDWVCENFEVTQKDIESDEDWMKRQ